MKRKIIDIFTKWWKLMSFVTSETQKCKNNGFGSHQ